MKDNTLKLIYYVIVILVFFVGSMYAHYVLGWGGEATLIISWVFGAILLFSMT